MEKVKKIDVHAHATPFPALSPRLFYDQNRFVSAEELIGMYDDLNIEKVVLLPLVSPEYHNEIITSGDCKMMADAHPDRFLWFCNADPRMCGNTPNADLSRLFRHYKAHGAKGVGEMTCNMYADDPFLDNLFAHAAACDMPVTIHIAPRVGGNYGIVDEVGLPRLEKMLKKHPNLKIFGHSQLFWAEISADVTEANREGYPTGKVKEGRIARLLREYPNLYCDISANSGMNALMRDADYAAAFMEEFSDRIMYGCDLCVFGQRHPYVFEEFLDEMLGKGKISERTYYNFVRGNAERLLGL